MNPNLDAMRCILAALTSASVDRHPEYHAALRDVALAIGLTDGRQITSEQLTWRIVRALADDPVLAGYACGPG